LLTPLIAGIIAIYHFRQALFGVNTPVRIGCGVALVVAGWMWARDAASALYPRLVARFTVGTAGVVGFSIRFTTLIFAVFVAFRIADLKPGTVIIGASTTAIILGLAAQQTVGNMLAGIVLLIARPFTVGDRVRFAGFGMDVEGTVASQGLLYVIMDDGEDTVLVPNNTALTMSVRPIREPASVNLRARLPVGTDPEAVQKQVEAAVGVATNGSPHVSLEEFDGAHVVMRIHATPAIHNEGGRLAREILGAVTELHAEVSV
jgi:small-conductance mechanosensitive channel